MVSELIHVEGFLSNLLDENRDLFLDRYTKEQLTGIEDFCKLVGSDCTDKNVFLKALTFTNLAVGKIKPAEPEPEDFSEMLQSES